MECGRSPIEFNGLAGRDSRWPHWKIAAMEKRAGEAGNRHGCGLDATVTKQKRRMNYEPES
jgi:hypothetical protein